MHLETSSTQVALVQSRPLEEVAPSGGGCKQVIQMEGLDPPTVVGIAFAAFTIGVLLTGALWFIHSHTGNVYIIILIVFLTSNFKNIEKA